MKSGNLFYTLALVVGDFLALLLAFSLAYILRVKLDERPLVESIPAMTYFWAFISILPMWILVHGFLGLYSPSVYERRFSELGRLLIGSFLGILVVIGYDFVSAGNLFPARLVPVYGVAFGFAILVVFRWAARIIRELLYHLNIGINGVVIIGDSLVTQKVINNIKNTATTGQKIIATVGKEIPGVPNFKNFESLVKNPLSEFNSIIQTELFADADANNQILNYAQTHHVAYRFIPGNSDMFSGNIAVELFAGSLPMVAVHQTALIGWGRILKRLFDIVIGSVTLVLFLPVIAIIALFIKILEPKGPVFFRQKRLTRFNTEFKVYKFRTMKQKYSLGKTPEQTFRDMGRPELVKKYRDNGDFLASDPRVTVIGRFLRLTSLDELPQLFNVVKGDISLVGPRALIPQELNEYDKKHAILSVKSGLTGLAQVSGRRDISFEERRKLDVYYVQNWSFWLDIVIILKTIWAVITLKGAK
jgi:exopolysaccharide biosynthesis polyprenyl glycosylphosphotransferase